MERSEVICHSPWLLDEQPVSFRFHLKTLAIVIPAKAGIHALGARVVWIPAFAGMTSFMSFRSGNGIRQRCGSGLARDEASRRNQGLIAGKPAPTQPVRSAPRLRLLDGQA
ncbi:hypothetical protein H0I39_12380 [Ottowia beijingensis]|uniref:Uncharacterized protein n=1 Tax=Ottowia beijingensis TaxID=1207057 RepID=A0A853IPF8_9BURK|nr:hypothetical protein [Ottowia beijingensis]NZA02356.1 hypothetical protein [Ottowia beijingensis]